MKTFLGKFNLSTQQEMPCDTVRKIAFIASHSKLVITFWLSAKRELYDVEVAAITPYELSAGIRRDYSFEEWQQRQFVQETRRSFANAPDAVWQAFCAVRGSTQIMPNLRWNRIEYVWDRVD